MADHRRFIAFSTGLSGSYQVRNRAENQRITGHERAHASIEQGHAVGPSGERHLMYAVQTLSLFYRENRQRGGSSNALESTCEQEGSRRKRRTPSTFSGRSFKVVTPTAK